MPSFPVAPQRPYEITQHGQTRIDNYYWMRDRHNPTVIEYITAENDYLEEMMMHTKELQEQLFQEMKARIKEDDSTVPERRDDYFYYTRFESGKQYPIFCRKHGSLDAPEEILLDQNQLAEGKSFSRIGAFAVSPDHKTLAYSIDPDGSEGCTLYFKNLETGEFYPEEITNTFGNVYTREGVAWANDNRTVFYVTRDHAFRPYKLYRHVLGTDPNDDVLLYHETDEMYFLYLFRLRSGKFIALTSLATITTEWRILSADDPQGEFQIFEPRKTGIEYQIEHSGDRFFIITNEDAQNFKLMETPVGATSRDNWREVIPHRADVLIEGMDAFENNLVLLERRDGLKQLRVSDADGVGNVRYVRFPDPVYNVQLSNNPEFDSNIVRFTYSSLITPNSVIDWHMDTGEWELKKQDEIPSGHDPSAYVTERLHATAPDGKKIPMSIVYKKGLEKNGKNPTLLYGYGAYGMSVEPAFNSNRFSLIDRGFIFVIAHIRGGSELGRAWYDDGKMLNKRNTFTDFIACAEFLIAEGYTSKDELAIMGGSAGGLLVGAVMTMRPDLFKAVVAQVPFVDIVSTMSDPTIPLTVIEYDQWGNPEDKMYFDYMMSYSPYDNLRPVEYPNVLITSGLNDPRVGYWEPTKFAAKLRALKKDDNLVLLKTNMDAGHAGASGRYDSLRELAFIYAFV